MDDELLRRQLAEIFAADQKHEDDASPGDELKDSPGARMVMVRPLAYDMIEAFLTANDLRHLRDSDGEYVIRFSGTDRRLGALEIGIHIAGTDGSILDLRGSFDARFERARFGPALIACNDWNKRFRIPKAVLLTQDDTGIIVLRQSVIFESGTFAGQVSETLDFYFTMTQDFHDWILEEHPGLF